MHVPRARVSRELSGTAQGRVRAGGGLAANFHGIRACEVWQCRIGATFALLCSPFLAALMRSYERDAIRDPGRDGDLHPPVRRMQSRPERQRSLFWATILPGRGRDRPGRAGQSLRLAGGVTPPPRPARPGAGNRVPGLPHVRDHRRAVAGVAFPGDRRRVRRPGRRPDRFHSARTTQGPPPDRPTRLP